MALQRHDRLLAEVIEEHGGMVVISRGEGDSFFAVFSSAVSAVEAAGDCQLRLGREAWPTGTALRVRMGLHTGEVRPRGGDHLDYGTDQPLCPGTGRRRMAGRYCSPRRRATWWRAGWAAGLG